MEELTPIIIWIVIAIAAFAKSSKARKMREKGTESPGTPEYGEAWPTRDTPRPAAPRPVMPRPTATIPTTPRPLATEPAGSRPTAPRPTASMPTGSRPAAPKPTATRPAAPFDVPAPKHAAEEAGEEFGGSVFGPVIRKTKAARKHLRTAAAAAPAGEAADRQPLRPTDAGQPAEQPANDANSGMAEAFDLRRAIIYSEILKPKFDE